MTEMTFDQAEALGYDGTQRTDNIAPTLEKQVEIMSARIAELQRLNEEKVRTIAEKDDRIVTLVNEIERVNAVAGELTKRVEDFDASKIRSQFRDDIAGWADENDLDREFVNGLLETLGLELLPEYVEAEIEVRVTVRFEAGAGVPSKPDAAWLNGELSVGAVEIRPAWSSGLEVEEISTDSHDVIGVVAH